MRVGFRVCHSFETRLITFSLIFGYCTPLMLSSAGNGAGWGPKTGYFFAGTCSLTAVAFYFGMPEVSTYSIYELMLATVQGTELCRTRRALCSPDPDSSICDYQNTEPASRRGAC